MNVEIIKKYKGQESRKIITIWGDNGALCRPYVDYFTKGNEYVLAISKMKDDFYLSNCGEYYLSIKEGKVKSEMGVLPEFPQIGEMEIKEFEKKLKQLNKVKKK